MPEIPIKRAKGRYSDLRVRFGTPNEQKKRLMIFPLMH